MDRSRSSARVRERKLRASYRRKICLAVILCLIIGIALGFLAGRWGTTQQFDLQSSPLGRVIPTDMITIGGGSSEPSGEDPIISLPTIYVESEATEAPEQPVEAPEETEEVASEATPEVTPNPTAAPTDAPTQTPAPTPTVEATIINVPFGQEQSFSIELKTDGTVRKAADADAYETLCFNLSVQRYLTNDYYRSTYGSTYQLKGTETSVAFEIMLKDYMGSQVIRPNDHNLLDISLETANGDVVTGNRVQDKEIEGSSDITLQTNVPVTLYKRFVYDPSQGDMQYMVVTTYENGVPKIYRFELGVPVRPTPEPTKMYSSLQKGSYNDDVVKLQQALVDQGYLANTADATDGNFGSKTEEAVKAAQTAFGMEATGVADHEFLVRLYGGN